VGFGGQTVKNVAGFDLTKFFIGSAGRLCVVTKISFHIHPLPEAASLCEIIIQGEKALRVVLSDLQTSFLIPSAVVVTHPPGGGNGSFRMLTAFEGHPKDVERQNRELLQLGQRVNGSGEIQWGREAMVKGLRSATDPEAVHTLRFKVCVPRVQGPSAYVALEQLADDLGVKTDIALIAGSGVLYVYALHKRSNAFRRFTEGITKIATDHDGHVLLIKAPSEIMSSWSPWIDPALSDHVLKPIKKMLDPKNVFPPLM
jgi:FAD/FMN-containing dehydrogenase